MGSRGWGTGTRGGSLGEVARDRIPIAARGELDRASEKARRYCVLSQQSSIGVPGLGGVAYWTSRIVCGFAAEDDGTPWRGGLQRYTDMWLVSPPVATRLVGSMFFRITLLCGLYGVSAFAASICRSTKSTLQTDVKYTSTTHARLSYVTALSVSGQEPQHPQQIPRGGIPFGPPSCFATHFYPAIPPYIRAELGAGESGNASLARTPKYAGCTRSRVRRQLLPPPGPRRQVTLQHRQPCPLARINLPHSPPLALRSLSEPV